jgi:16S rRNA (guanine(1405)-N(7))-methyltransferase
MSGEAFYGDILLNPPHQPADVAFFFKEAHRFEQRQKGCNRAFWLALNVRWLVVSLPATNLTGRFDLANRQRKLVKETLAGFDWPVTEIMVGNELIFCIRKEIA